MRGFTKRLQVRLTLTKEHNVDNEYLNDHVIRVDATCLTEDQTYIFYGIGKRWTATRFSDEVHVIAPSEHEVLLALKFGVKV